MVEARWVLPEAPPAAVELALSDYSPIERQILYMRGIQTKKDAARFMLSELPEHHDPFLMKGMKQAAERLVKAAEKGERIVIYGDYDADGITATVLLLDFLKEMGVDAGHYIPDRFDEGYGLNGEAIRQIKQEGAQILLSVDCGVRSLAEVALANSLGMEVIITDHHQPSERLPTAVAIINAKQEDDEYPFKHLTGVGIAYKLAQALSDQMGCSVGSQYLDLVALGTIADVGQLWGENRTLVAQGLKALNRLERPGLRALADTAGLVEGRIDAQAIGFVIGPRINAAGRLGSAEISVQLLRSRDLNEAIPQARMLEKMNRERQRMTLEAVQKAHELAIAEEARPLLIFTEDPGFHEGVVGLAASRLRDEFYRPTIVGARGEEETRCSARSIPEVSIIAMLDACSDLLTRYGGHETAAGFTLATDRLAEFKRKIGGLVESELQGRDLAPQLPIDCEVEFRDLSHDLIPFLESLEPCGRGNPRPVLMARDIKVIAKRRVGGEGRHLKLSLGSPDRVFDGIAFRKGDRMDALPARLDVAFHFEINEYLGIESLQLNVVDMKATG